MMRRVIWLCIIVLLAAGAAPGQTGKLKVYISTDMEGIGGVSTWQIQAGAQGREYDSALSHLPATLRLDPLPQSALPTISATFRQVATRLVETETDSGQTPKYLDYAIKRQSRLTTYSTWMICCWVEVSRCCVPLEETLDLQVGDC